MQEPHLALFPEVEPLNVARSPEMQMRGLMVLLVLGVSLPVCSALELLPAPSALSPMQQSGEFLKSLADRRFVCVGGRPQIPPYLRPSPPLELHESLRLRLRMHWTRVAV